MIGAFAEMFEGDEVAFEASDLAGVLADVPNVSDQGEVVEDEDGDEAVQGVIVGLGVEGAVEAEQIADAVEPGFE